MACDLAGEPRWLLAINPGIGDGLADIRDVLLEVLIEHLGRWPEVAELVRANLIVLSEANPRSAQEFVGRLARLGSLGWAVLIPLLQPPEKYPFQDTIFALALNHPVVLPLIHQHAHAAILKAELNTGLSVLAVLVLAKLGPVAGMAFPTCWIWPCGPVHGDDRGRSSTESRGWLPISRCNRSHAEPHP
ncbi:MAG: hypothetical protein U0792_07720 [Gemmataceae bacterium]